MVVRYACRNIVSSRERRSFVLPLPIAITSISSKLSTHFVGSWMGWIWEFVFICRGNLIKPVKWEKYRIFKKCIQLTRNLVDILCCTNTNQYHTVAHFHSVDSWGEYNDHSLRRQFHRMHHHFDQCQRTLWEFDCILSNVLLLKPTYKMEICCCVKCTFPRCLKPTIYTFSKKSTNPPYLSLINEPLQYAPPKRIYTKNG